MTWLWLVAKVLKYGSTAVTFKLFLLKSVLVLFTNVIIEHGILSLFIYMYMCHYMVKETTKHKRKTTNNSCIHCTH